MAQHHVTVALPPVNRGEVRFYETTDDGRCLLSDRHGPVEGFRPDTDGLVVWRDDDTWGEILVSHTWKREAGGEKMDRAMKAADDGAGRAINWRFVVWDASLGEYDANGKWSPLESVMRQIRTA